MLFQFSGQLQKRFFRGNCCDKISFLVFVIFVAWGGSCSKISFQFGEFTIQSCKSFQWCFISNSCTASKRILGRGSYEIDFPKKTSNASMGEAVHPASNTSQLSLCNEEGQSATGRRSIYNTESHKIATIALQISTRLC